MIPDELRGHRILSVGQLTRAGVTPVDTRQALAAGELTRLKRGWYTPRSMEWPTDRHALVVQAELKDHPGTVPSHQSGAILLGYPVHRPDLKRVHLMRVDDGPARSRPTVVIHRRVDDAAVLLPALVIAQTALTCPVSGLMAIDHALRTGSVTLADVESWCSRLKDHVGRAHLVPVLALADGRRESPLESHSALTFHHWGWRLHPQFEVPGTQYRADARLGVVGQLGRHQVVELTVQVRHRQHGQHPSHGLVLGLLSGDGHAVGVADTADTVDTVRPAKKPAVIRSNEAA